MKKIIFVCLGNICRSPAADGVMLSEVKRLGIEDKFLIDSAGTSAFHEGEKADSRMRKHARSRGFDLTSISRGFKEEDFEEFDLILAMDKSNYKNILKFDPSGKNHHKVKLFCEFCSNRSESEVPDPYYGGAQGFETVLDIVEDGVNGLIKTYG